MIGLIGGTGLGGELINELVPRDHSRRPVLLATHVKGLMRESFRHAMSSLGWNDDLEPRVFGSPDETRPDVQSAFRLTDASATNGQDTLLVSRTAVEDTGK